MEAAFPFLAIILGATLLIERLTKLHEESEKLANAQTNMGETVQSVFNKLDDKLLEVGIKTDELNGNHLAALRKQLELIDHEEFKSLIEEFNTLDKVSIRGWIDATEFKDRAIRDRLRVLTDSGR